MLILGGLALLPPEAGAVDWVKNDLGKPYDGAASGGLYGVAIGDGNRDNRTEVYYTCYDNGHVYMYAFDGKWSNKDLGALGRATYADAVIIGDADDDGKKEVYASGMALENSQYTSHVYQLVRTDAGWSRTDMGASGYWSSDLSIGDGNGDGRTELYTADLYYGHIYQFSKGNGWNIEDVGVAPSFQYYNWWYTPYMYGVVAGDGDNDGKVEVYGAASDNHLYRFNYSGSAWNRADMGTGEQASYPWYGMLAVALGDADNDGYNELYAASYLNATIWRYKWNNASKSWGTTKLVMLGSGTNANDVCIGDGDSDGSLELYVATSNRQVYQVEYNTNSGAWESSSVGGGNGAMNAIDIGSATNDTAVREIYAACGDGHAYQFYSDRTPPANPTVWSDTHPSPGTWYTATVVHVLWKDGAFDISGIDGYSIEWDTSANTVPDDVRDLQETVHDAYSSELADGDSWYFHIRSRDNSLNWNASATHFGPIKIDTTPPDKPQLTINSGAEYTNNSLVTLSLSAQDPSPGSGVAWMSFSNDGKYWSDWEKYSGSRSGWDLTDARYGGNDSDGVRYVHAKIKDLVGNEISVENRTSDSIFLDRVAPLGLSVVINGDAVYATSDGVTLKLTASDPDPASGLWMMSFSNDGVSWGEWVAWESNLTTDWSLTAGAGGTDVDGSKTVYFRIKDHAENFGGPATDSIFLDRKAPESLSILINGGQEYTNAATAQLDISAIDPDPGSKLSEMTLANEEGSLGTWEGYASLKKDWSLVSGTGGTDTDGKKIVFLKVRDGAGNAGGPVSDTIFLDRVKPRVGIMINGGAKYTTSPIVTIMLKAGDADPSSGLYMMQFGDDGVKWTDWEPYVEKKSYTLPAPDGKKTVYVQIKDRAGNIADPAMAVIILDTASPQLSNVRVVGITDTSAIITWTTDEDSDSGVDWGLTTLYGSSKLDASLVTSHSVQLSGLAATTTYHFRVYSRDPAGNPPAFSLDYVFITAAVPDTTAPSISNIQVTGITDRLAVVSWSTNEPADSLVEFGKDTNYGLRTNDVNFVLKHSQVLVKLEPSTTYHFRVASRDPSGNGPTTSADYTFETEAAPDIIPPVISNVKVSGLTDKLAVISWETDEPADGVVEFGNTTSYGMQVGQTGLNTLHELTLINLNPYTTYHFRVRSTDASKNGPAYSVDYSFQTNALPDTVPPAISNVRVEGITETTAMVLWETDEISDSFVEYGAFTSYGLSSADNTNTARHGLLLQGLTADKTYHFRVRSTDPSMNTATSGDFVFKTKKNPAAPDTQPPQISGVLVTGISNTHVVIIWQTDELATSEVEYGNSTNLGQRASDASYVMVHSIMLDGLKPSTEYYLRVRSTDVYGNGPAVSQQFRFTTAAAPDLFPPVISNIRVTGVTNTSAVITWDTDEPATALVEYGLDTYYGRNQTSSVFLMNHSVMLTGLSPGKTYHFRVRSRDSSSNLAAPSVDGTFTTQTGTAPPGKKNPITDNGAIPWLWVALILILVGMAAGLLTYRRYSIRKVPPWDPQQVALSQEAQQALSSASESDTDLDAEAAADSQADGGVETLEMETAEVIPMDEVSAPSYGRVSEPAYAATPGSRQQAAGSRDFRQATQAAASWDSQPVRSVEPWDMAVPAAAGAAAAARPAPRPAPAVAPPPPLRHIRCPSCRTRIPIYKEGPQQVQCPNCGKKGPYVPKAVGTLASASMPVAAPEPQPAPVDYGQAQEPAPAKTIRCTNCGSRVPIYSTDYPVRITCPGCGKSGMYRGPRTQ